MGAHLRPVEAPAAGHEHEHVVVLAAPDDDRPQQGTELDPLELGALLGAVGALGPDDVGRDAGGARSPRWPASVGRARSRPLGQWRRSASPGVGCDLGDRGRCRGRRASGGGGGGGARRARRRTGRRRSPSRGRPAWPTACVPGGMAGLGRFDERASTIRSGREVDGSGPAVSRRSSRLVIAPLESCRSAASIPADRWYGGPKLRKLADELE